MALYCCSVHFQLLHMLRFCWTHAYHVLVHSFTPSFIHTLPHLWLSSFNNTSTIPSNSWRCSSISTRTATDLHPEPVTLRGEDVKWANGGSKTGLKRTCGGFWGHKVNRQIWFDSSEIMDDWANKVRLKGRAALSLLNNVLIKNCGMHHQGAHPGSCVTCNYANNEFNQSLWILHNLVILSNHRQLDQIAKSHRIHVTSFAKFSVWRQKSLWLQTTEFHQDLIMV